VATLTGLPPADIDIDFWDDILGNINGALLYELTQDTVGSRHAYLIVRTFIDADNPKDIKAANAAQDKIKIEGGGNGPLDIPNWNMKHLLAIRGALNTLAKHGGNAAMAFGTKEETRPIDHLVFAGAGWGGLPQKNAFYETLQSQTTMVRLRQLRLKTSPLMPSGQ